jgi:N-methylhydantoinase A/oxoprolinase/acetone carboxylase beta subunit
MRLDKLVKVAVAALDDIKGQDIKVLDVRKLTSLFDKIVLAIADSKAKRPFFTSQERIAMAREVLAAGSRVEGPAIVQQFDATTMIEPGAAVVLSLRALRLTPDRWRQFWDKLDRFGFPAAVA